MPTSGRRGCCGRGCGFTTGWRGSRLPASETVDVTHHPIGNALKRPFGTAFEYSDCMVDDPRLVVLSAVDAAERGAAICTGARCVRADRADSGGSPSSTAAIAARSRRARWSSHGAWTAIGADTVLRVPAPPLGTTQISQIVVKRLFDSDNVYVFQNHDRRLIFASPYERDFTLIGSVGHPFKGDPAVVSMAAPTSPISAMPPTAISANGSKPPTWCRTVSAANSVLGRGKRGPRARRRAMTFDAGARKAPLMTIFGGDITTARLRAERAVSQLSRFYPMSPRWTATTPLPGGDFGWAKFEEEVDCARDQWHFLTEARHGAWFRPMARSLVTILGDAKEKKKISAPPSAPISPAPKCATS